MSQQCRVCIVALVIGISTFTPALAGTQKPTPDQAVGLLQEGNRRFVQGRSNHPNTGVDRLAQAGRENQADYAYATILTCSDSRVPVERVFDAGVMDLFVIRVAGNVCDTDEIGSIEYGLSHVHTPVLVVLGHTQCGAVTAVTHAMQGHGHALELNIPPLVDNIGPAVQRTMAQHVGLQGGELIERAIEENVWQAVADLLTRSPSTRQLLIDGKVQIRGAIYDVASGHINWLDEQRAAQILAAVQQDPNRQTQAMATSMTSNGDGPMRHPAAGLLSAHGDTTAATTSTRSRNDRSPSAADAVAAAIGAPGAFAKPAPAAVNRPPFGVTAGTAEAFTHRQIQSTSQVLVSVFWVLTAMTLVGTLWVAWWLGSIRTADGACKWGLTLGTKLTAGFGSLATLIMLVSSLSLAGQQANSKHQAELGDIVGDAALLDLMQQNMLMVRMNVKDFLITHSDEDLKQYSDYLATTTKLHEAAVEEVHDPQRAAMVREIGDKLESYQERFVEVVKALDKRNGVVKGQLDVAGARLTQVLEAIIETAHEDGDLVAALDAANVMDHFAMARLDVMKFLRTSDQADARAAIEQMEEGAKLLRALHADVEHPIRKKWVKEAEEGYSFYADRVEHTIDLVHECDRLVLESLDVIGPQIAAIGRDLIASIHGREAELEAQAEANAASMRVKAVSVSGVAFMVALGVGLVLVRSLTRAIGRVLDVLQRVANGDLTADALGMTTSDEMGELGRATDTMSAALRSLVRDVTSSASEVAGAATEIAASSEEIAQGTTQQAEQVTQISSAIEEMSASIVEVARKSSEAATSAGDSGRIAQEGNKVVEETIVGMQSIDDAVSASATSVAELGKRGEQIGKIVEVINDIADQTNLLALNAAIEAARAGEHGRGFAVVADEVRKLADRTTKATDEIAESIQAIQGETNEAVQRMNAGTEQVKTGVEHARQAGDSLAKIVTSASEVAQMVQSIAAAAEEQSAASEQVSRNIESISSVVQQTNEGTQQAASAAASLSQKAEHLQQLVARFRVK